ncbi:MAG TPA: hypothetical protein PK205_15555, partial [Promineifilum sp.]|nr:hypothetical protein [Promineifilum sp.]
GRGEGEKGRRGEREKGGKGEGERADVGVSLVFYPRLAADGRTVVGMAMVESADVVMFPASAGSRIVGEITNDESGMTNEERRAANYVLRTTNDERRMTGDKGDGAGYGAAARSVALGLWAAGGAEQEEGDIASHSQSANPQPNPTKAALPTRAAAPAHSMASHSLLNNQQLHSAQQTEPTSPNPAGPTNCGTGRRLASSPLAQAASFSGAAAIRRGDASCSTGRWLASPPLAQAASFSGTAAIRRGDASCGASCRLASSPLAQPASFSGAAAVRRGDASCSASCQLAQQGNPHLSTQTNQQENNSMTQQTEGTLAPRVALVMTTDNRPSSPDSGQSVVGRPADPWLDTLRTTTAEAVIRASGLPPVVQERLSAARYETTEALNSAVAGARAELAALNEAGVVRLDGLRPFAAARLRDGLDEARELMGFFFGAAGAATPPGNMRSFADLYVALTGDAHFRGVFDGGRVLFSGATTATLPNLAVDAMNRVIAEQFAALEHYRWYERVASVAPNDGRLHAMKWLTLGGIGDLPAVSEGAAYTELSVADAKESASFVKRGGYVGITREMIKNGDIMQMQAIPRALAAAAVRTRSAAVGALFTANSGVGPTLAQDSKALFHLDHANLATTALGTDAAAWRAARSECFQQPELGGGKPLGIFPRYLLVPAELYDTALSILGYGEGMPTVYTPEAQGRGFADPRPIPLVVPEWTDATDWAYIVDPALFPVIQMSYSQAPGGRSHPIPELFAVVSETSGLMFSNDVLPIKVRDEFALGVNGPRGIGKRNVA